MKGPASGFTLIELLVVIAIIGVLSSVVLASVSTARTKAQYAVVQLELNKFAEDAMLAQQESHNTLLQITGSGCSDCGGCRVSTSLKNVPTSNGCYTSWVNDVTTIQSATNGYVNNLTSVLRDPWGSPYTLDENEGEVPANPCVADTVRSVGADGIWNSSDDYIVLVPFSLPQCR